MDKTCTILQDIKEKIDSGMDPDKAVPYHPVICEDPEQEIEVLYYAVQVLPDGRRKDFLKLKLDEVLKNVRRTESKL